MCIYHVTFDVKITTGLHRQNPSKCACNFFMSSSFLMKHGAVYAFYKSPLPIFYRRLIGVLVSSNTSTNLLSKFSCDNTSASDNIAVLNKQFIVVFDKLIINHKKLHICSKTCQLKHLERVTCTIH